MLWFQARAGDFSRAGSESETSGIADCESHLAVLVPRDFVVVSRAGHLKFGALCVGSIKRSQRKASREGGARVPLPASKALRIFHCRSATKPKASCCRILTAKGICGENSKRERRTESTRDTSALNSSKLQPTRLRISRT